MAGAGKTSVGKALAEKLNYKFIDTDKVIEDTHKSSLQGLLEKYGYLKLREIEEKEVLSLSIDGSIISTGGSVVYGSEAMNFLNENSTIVYLEMSLEQIHKRNINFSNRGFAKHPFCSPLIETPRSFFLSVTFSAESCWTTDIVGFQV